MQLYSRIVANLLVISVKILVNLPVKLAELRVRGAIGAPGPGNTLGRGSYRLEWRRTSRRRICWSPENEGLGPTPNETNETIMKTIARNIAGIARNTRNITRCTRIFLEYY